MARTASDPKIAPPMAQDPVSADRQEIKPDICVIGAGAGGLSAAAAAAAFGVHVVLIEKTRMGGGNRNNGALPSKACWRRPSAPISGAMESGKMEFHTATRASTGLRLPLRRRAARRAFLPILLPCAHMCATSSPQSGRRIRASVSTGSASALIAGAGAVYRAVDRGRQRLRHQGPPLCHRHRLDPGHSGDPWACRHALSDR